MRPAGLHDRVYRALATVAQESAAEAATLTDCLRLELGAIESPEQAAHLRGAGFGRPMSCHGSPPWRWLGDDIVGQRGGGDRWSDRTRTSYGMIVTLAAFEARISDPRANRSA
jgi:hypothetical protein